jgi:hypothetical protein
LQNGGDQSNIIETSFTNLKNWELLSCSLHAITVATLPCFPSEFREDQEQCVCTRARASSQQQQMSRSVWHNYTFLKPNEVQLLSSKKKRAMLLHSSN